MEVDYKQPKIDAIVRQLQAKSFEVTKALHDGKPFLKHLEELESEIGKLTAIQKRGNPDKRKEPDRRYYDWKPFIKWLKDNSFPNIDDFEITYNPESGHGLSAKKDIKAGDPVLQVPLRFMMTNKTAIESPKLALLLHNDQLLQNVFSLTLALHLLIEQRTLNSFWTPYINSLPKKVPNSPLYWNYETMLKLQGTYTLEELAKFKASFVKSYCHIYFRLEKQLELAVMKRSSFTYNSFAWAYTITYSRQNKIMVAGTGNKPIPCYALVPLFDLLNHEPNKEITSNYDFEKEILESHAIRDFKKGEEIKIFYGPRPNVELFLYSGFVVPKNKHNFSVVHFNLLESDKMKEKKSEILHAHDLPNNAKFAMPSDSPIQEELLSFLRVALINNEEDLKQAELAFQKRNITLENELRVFNILELKLNQMLDSFPTKLEEDLKSIEGLSPGASVTQQYFILQLLIDEKTIFNSALKFVKTKKKTLENKIKQKVKPNPTVEKGET